MRYAGLSLYDMLMSGYFDCKEKLTLLYVKIAWALTVAGFKGGVLHRDLHMRNITMKPTLYAFASPTPTARLTLPAVIAND